MKLNDRKSVFDGALAVAKLAIAHAKKDGAAVLLLGDLAHMNERGIEDQLVVVNLLAGDDEAEGSDKPLTRRFRFQRAFARFKLQVT